jgi:hypothetical protein
LPRAIVARKRLNVIEAPSFSAACKKRSRYIMRVVFTPVPAFARTSVRVAVPSSTVSSSDTSEMSACTTTPKSAARRFMVSRTRHAPVPEDNVSWPARAIMVVLSESEAPVASAWGCSITSSQ